MPLLKHDPLDDVLIYMADIRKQLGACVSENGRGERIRTSGLYVPNVALYQAEPHAVIRPLTIIPFLGAIVNGCFRIIFYDE